MALAVLVLLTLFLALEVKSAGILFPRSSESREVLPLDGLWSFSVGNITDPTGDHVEEWYKIDMRAASDLNVQFMPVPSSYNDIGVDANLRDHVGLVWYQRKIFAPARWLGDRIFIRFSSVCRAADVWVNGEYVTGHTIGHLPFQADVTSVIKLGEENIITVAVDNTLTQTTVPQGSVDELASGRQKQNYNFDFFNYAGIDRPVVLYTTPSTYIDDITIAIDIDGANGFVQYSVGIEGSYPVIVKVSLFDKEGLQIDTDTLFVGSLFVPNATFWWPYLMDPHPGYLYNLEVQLEDGSGNLIDKYTLPVGIRTVTWDSSSVKINNKNIYLRGFGRHEDSDIRGKGLDFPTIVRDHNLIKWIGANSYRTSHYPYAEEIMDMADELGIMIIDECPAINTENFSDELLENHKQSLTELIQRDKNRPSVIMWSAANEPRTQFSTAEDYYRQVIAHIKSLDSSRPVTVVNNQLPQAELSGQFLDVACCNIYEAWYSDSGDIDLIMSTVTTVVRRWNRMHNIPVIVSEYGADTQEGLHFLPSYIWSEEYQDAFLSAYFETFDALREEGILIGEMVWNFADFKTAEDYKRAGGNKKGIFTRNRQPKSSAHLLRKRYWALAEELDDAEKPADLGTYVYASGSKKRDEL